MKNISAILIVFISILALNACNNTPASVMEDTWVEIKDTTHLPDIDTLDGYWEEFRGIIVRNSEEYSSIPKRIIDTTYSKKVFTGTLPEAPDFASYSYLAYTFFEVDIIKFPQYNRVPQVKLRRVLRNDSQKKIRYELDVMQDPIFAYPFGLQLVHRQNWIRIPKVPIDYSFEIDIILIPFD
jgi:hypothetical protein